MAVSLEEMKARLNISPEREAKIQSRAKQLIEEELTLRDLRKARQLTQERVAELLGVEQDGISRAERRGNMLLSTLSSYIEAMGGKLRLVAEFPDRAPVTVRLGDLVEPGEQSRPKRKSSRKRPAQVG